MNRLFLIFCIQCKEGFKTRVDGFDRGTHIVFNVIYDNAWAHQIPNGANEYWEWLTSCLCWYETLFPSLKFGLKIVQSLKLYKFLFIYYRCLITKYLNTETSHIYLFIIYLLHIYYIFTSTWTMKKSKISIREGFWFAAFLFVLTDPNKRGRSKKASTSIFPIIQYVHKPYIPFII